MKKLIIILLLCSCIDNPLNTENETKENISIAKNNSINVINKTNIIDKNKIIIKTLYNYRNITLNLSIKQINQINNMKPHLCNNVGCSEGFFQAKDQCKLILNLPLTKFKEKPSSGVMELLYTNMSKNEYVRIQEDNYTKFIRLPSMNWFVSHTSDTSDIIIRFKK